jgi:hypothetical protein
MKNFQVILGKENSCHIHPSCPRNCAINKISTKNMEKPDM